MTRQSRVIRSGSAAQTVVVSLRKERVRPIEAPVRAPVFEDVEAFTDGYAPTGAAYDEAYELGEDDAWFAATGKRRRMKRAALVIGALASAFVLTIALTSGSDDAAELAVTPAQAHVEAPPLPSVPSVPAVAAAAVPAPTPEVSPVVEAEPEPTPGPAPIAKKTRKGKGAPVVALPTTDTTVTRYFAAPPPKKIEPHRLDLGAVIAGANNDAVESPEQEIDDSEPTPVRARPTALLWSEPGGAAVSLDGRYVGRTPLNVSWDLNRNTSLELSLAGYDTAEMVLTPASSSGLLKVTLHAANEMVEPDEEEQEPAPAPAPPPRIDLKNAFDGAPPAPKKKTESAMPEPTRR